MERRPPRRRRPVRGLTVVALLVACACFGAVPPAAGGGGDEVRVAGVLTGLAGDRTTVLAAVRREGCALLVVWKPPQRPREVRRECARGAAPTFDSVALSGGAAAWTTARRRGVRVERTLSVAPMQRVGCTPTVLSRAVAFERRGRAPTGETIDSLVGDAVARRPSFAFRKHRHTGASHRPDAIYLVQNGELRALLRNVVADLTAADAGRFVLVFPLPGRIAVFGSGGETVATFDVGAESLPVAAKLSGDRMVVVSGRRGAGIEPEGPFTAETVSLRTNDAAAPWELDGLPVETRAGLAAYTHEGRLVRRDLASGETAELMGAIGPAVRLAALDRRFVAGIAEAVKGRPTVTLRLFASRPR